MALTPKPFDTLLLLVERGGTLVSKPEMMAALWPSTAVEEGNLAWNISAVRRALTDESATAFIETVPKFGYRFIAPVSEITPAVETAIDEEAPAAAIGLPPAASRPVPAVSVRTLLAALAIVGAAVAFAVALGQ